MSTKKIKIAVIGAGIAGLNLANILSAQANVTVFEKSAKLGGRAATREVDEYAFDHGAQFFTVKSNAFKQFVDKMEAEGVVARWDARFAEIRHGHITSQRRWDASYPHYVGTPSMHAIGQFMAKDLDVRFNQQIQSIKRENNAWVVTSAHEELGVYDWVVLSIPAAQAYALLPDNCQFKLQLSDISMLACYALMLAYPEPKVMQWDAALISGDVLSWASVNSSKPDRPSVFSMVAMSKNLWAEAHFNHDDAFVTQAMLTELSAIIGRPMDDFSYLKLKRWKYANAARRAESMLLLDDNLQLACCGDWCKVGRIESAFTSSLELASAMQLN